MKKLFLLFCCIALPFFSCEKDPQGGIFLLDEYGTLVEAYPTVSTANVSIITQNSARCGGNVTGGTQETQAIAKGVCWSKTSNEPTISNSHTTDGWGAGSFTSSMTNLSSNTTYYVRAYATNSFGTSYGETKKFTTDSPPAVTLPVVHTSNVTNVGLYSAKCGGNVTSDGGAPVTARGVCWFRASEPTINSDHTTDGTGTGIFTSSITGLSTITTYYVRAYATNSAGTAYGETRTFMTGH